jgi:hypothetical protein
MYSYIYLAVGLTVAFLTQTLRTRLLILALAAVVPLYIDLRYFGILDRQWLTSLDLFKRMAKEGSLNIRLLQEDEVFDAIGVTGTWFGTGVNVFRFKYVRPLMRYPSFDSLWNPLLFTGGFIGMTLHYLASHVAPIFLALVSPRERPDRRAAGSPAWGLALFSALVMVSTLQNASALPTLMALIGGAMAGQAVTRRAWTRVESAPHRAPSEGSSSVPQAVPLVAALACVLLVLADGPALGRPVMPNIPSSVAALMFAVAGWAGSWAAGRFPVARVVIYGLMVGALGLSWNLLRQPDGHPLTSADLFQGMSVCGVTVALWRKKWGESVWAESVLGIVPMVVHFLAGPYLPEVPGSQYLWSGSVGGGAALFPLCPWLTLAVLGAWASRERPGFNLVMAGLFAAAAGVAWAVAGARGGPWVSSGNLASLMLACAAVGLAFALAQVLSRHEPTRRALRWLGARWLVFLFVHGLVILATGRLDVLWSSLDVWVVVGLGSLALTWLVWAALAPLKPWFRQPFPWFVLMAAVLVAGLVPGIPPWIVAVVGGGVGLFFGAHYGALASSVATWNADTLGLLIDRRRQGSAPRPEPAPKPREPEEERAREPLGAGEFTRNVVRLLVVLVLLAAPELIGALTGSSRRAHRAGGDHPAVMPPPETKPLEQRELRHDRERAVTPQAP